MSPPACSNRTACSDPLVHMQTRLPCGSIQLHGHLCLCDLMCWAHLQIACPAWCPCINWAASPLLGRVIHVQACQCSPVGDDILYDACILICQRAED